MPLQENMRFASWTGFKLALPELCLILWSFGCLPSWLALTGMTWLFQNVKINDLTYIHLLRSLHSCEVFSPFLDSMTVFFKIQILEILRRVLFTIQRHSRSVLGLQCRNLSHLLFNYFLIILLFQFFVLGLPVPKLSMILFWVLFFSLIFDIKLRFFTFVSRFMAELLFQQVQGAI